MAPSTTQFTVRPQDLTPADDNVRTNLGDLTDLIDSIQSHGVIEPVVAYEENGSYHLVTGHRRVEAAKQAGIDEVPVRVIPKPTDNERTEIMLIENLQREDLNPVDEARGYARLKDMGISAKQIAKRVGRSTGLLSMRLGLLELPDDVLNEIRNGRISLQDANNLREVFREDGAREAWGWALSEAGDDGMFPDIQADEAIDAWIVRERLAEARDAKVLSDQIDALPEDATLINLSSLDEKERKKVATLDELGVSEEDVKSHDLFAYAVIDGALVPVISDKTKFRSEIKKAMNAEGEDAPAVPEGIKTAFETAEQEAERKRQEREREQAQAEVFRRSASAAAGLIKKKTDQDAIIDAHWLNSLSNAQAGEIVRALGVDPIEHDEQVTETDAEGNEVPVMNVAEDGTETPKTRTVKDHVATVKREAENVGVRHLMLTSILLADRDSDEFKALPKAATQAIKEAESKVVKDIAEERAKAAAAKEEEAAKKAKERAAVKAEAARQKAEKAAKAAAEAAAAAGGEPQDVTE